MRNLERGQRPGSRPRPKKSAVLCGSKTRRADDLDAVTAVLTDGRLTGSVVLSERRGFVGSRASYPSTTIPMDIDMGHLPNSLDGADIH